MSKNYDNWERLVAAVLRREHDRQIALSHSRDPSIISSPSSSFNSLLHDQLPAANFEAMNYFNSERFSSMDYQETTSRPESLSYFLDERTGKKCYMAGARDLEISFGNSSQNWKWRYDANSRSFIRYPTPAGFFYCKLFSEVAELHSVWRLDIRAKIKARMLHPWTVYAAYLVFKIAERAEGLESAKGTIRFVDNESDRDAVKRARTVHLQPVNDTKGEIAVERGDGWMEVEMGNFYIGQGDDGEVEARLLEIRRWKTGLIVQGILFRPTYTYVEAPLVSKQYMLTNVWG